MQKSKIFILPGELIISVHNVQISTLVVSGVAVSIYNRQSKFGGMNHFIRPYAESSDTPGKYGNLSISQLMDKAFKIDSDPANYEAKIFGGGRGDGMLDMKSDISLKEGENVAKAIEMLGNFSIKIVEQDVGGDKAMKVIFNNTTGKSEIEYVTHKRYENSGSDSKDSHLDTADQGSKGKIRTLVIDDSSTVRKIIRTALSGIDDIEVVAEAADPFDGRLKILEFNPDVILLDIVMPNMDGLTFLRKLMTYYPKPVIILSSVACEGSRMKSRAESLGAIAVLDKEELKLFDKPEVVRNVLADAIRRSSKEKVKKLDNIDA